MTKLRIIKEYDDHEPVVLGQVQTGHQPPVAKRLAEEAWLAFQKTEPDTDHKFIDYLVKEYGFRSIEDEFIDLVV
jgi:hypothetical protein